MRALLFLILHRLTKRVADGGEPQRSCAWGGRSSQAGRLRLTRPICGTYGKHFLVVELVETLASSFSAPKQSPRLPRIDWRSHVETGRRYPPQFPSPLTYTPIEVYR
jgi:hypothetical protein